MDIDVVRKMFVTRNLARFGFECARLNLGIPYLRSDVIELSNKLWDIGSFETKDGYFTATFSKSRLESIYLLGVVISTNLAITMLKDVLISTLENLSEFEGIKVNLIVKE